ncbi:PEPxxWA-CTERM sorting domain-containing protein [Phenylobacterium sp.]|jgi:hypothetical protein|uniref:PEPxxWA-CTERM sorting domain-containing protein n=1 Tax=Phenylobacterium sp. TaxID=1871053 RepID=UPI0035B49607
MFKAFAAAAVASIALACAGGASAAAVTVYNTGQGAAAGNGQADAHYTISGSDFGASGQAKTYYNPAYAAEDGDSRWVSYSGSPFSGVGFTTFQTTFDLTGYDIASAVLSGRWGVDNEGVVLLNGVQIASLSGTLYENFNQLHQFGANSGFLQGLNTLQFVVHDTGSPMAFRTDDMSLTANVSAVPEPATWAMMIVGFGLVGATVRRRSLAFATVRA